LESASHAEAEIVAMVRFLQQPVSRFAQQQHRHYQIDDGEIYARISQQDGMVNTLISIVCFLTNFVVENVGVFR
jgi:hypothetical protein